MSTWKIKLETHFVKNIYIVLLYIDYIIIIIIIIYIIDLFSLSLSLSLSLLSLSLSLSLYIYIYIYIIYNIIYIYKIIKCYLRWVGIKLFPLYKQIHNACFDFTYCVDIDWAKSSSYFPCCFKDKPWFPIHIPLNSLNFFQVQTTQIGIISWTKAP